MRAPLRLGVGHAVAAALILAVAPGAPVAAENAAPARVGVVVTARVNLDGDSAQRLARDLGAAIRTGLEVDAVVAGEVDGPTPDCAASAGCLRELGDELEADELLLLVLTRVGDRIEVETTWARPSSGEVEGRGSMQLTATEQTWNESLSASAPVLLPHIGRRAVPAAPPAIETEDLRRTSRVAMVVDANRDSRRDEGGPTRELGPGFWTTASVSAVSLTGATTLALRARSDYRELEDDGCAERQCESDRVDRLQRRSTAADVLFGVGLVSGAAAIYMFATAPERSPKVGVRATDGGAAVWIGGAL